MLSEAHIARIQQNYGIPPETARKLAEQNILASVTKEEAAQLLELSTDKLEGGGILIRYPSISEDVFTIRLDTPLKVKEKNGKEKERKYLRPAGRGNHLFIPPQVNIAAEQEIWITEGEMKALTAADSGLPCVALAGVWNWRQDVDEDDPVLAAAKLTGENGKAPDSDAIINDLKQDWTGKRIVLIYDSDIDRTHPAWSAFPRLAEQLYRYGAEEVKIVTLPSLEENNKTGIDDYIRIRRAEGHDAAAELREIVKRAPVWVPNGGYLFDCVEKVGTLEGLEKFAKAYLASDNPEKRILGAAAYYLAQRETMLQSALNQLGIRGEAAATLKRDAKTEAERIRERQKHIYRPDEKNSIQTTSSVWPDAPHVSSDFYCPVGYHWAETALEKEEIRFRENEVVTEYIPLCAPVFISKILDSIDNNERRYEITFFHGGNGSNNGEEWVSEYIKPAALVDKKKFASEVLNRGLLLYSAKKLDDVLEYFTKFIEINVDKIPMGKYTSTAGRLLTDDSFIVYPRGAWGKNSIIENPPVIYFDDATPEFLYSISPLPDGTEAEAKQVVSTLLKSAEPATAWTIAGWFTAALLAPLIRQVWNEFPILNVYGGKGSGKSSLIQAFCRAFFALDVLGSARRPPFSILKELSSTNFFPVVLDEYRTTDINSQHQDNLHHYLRQAYKGTRETRGRPDQTTVDYFLVAPIALLGESRVDDAAVRERSVIIAASKASIVDYPGARDAYNSLLDREEALRRTAGWLWGRSLEITSDEVADTLRKIEAGLRGKVELADRPRHNLAITLYGILWLNNLLKLDFTTDTYKAIIEKFERTYKEEDTQVDYFIRYLELENSLPPTKRTIPMRRDGDELVTHQTAAIEAYAGYARKQHIMFLGRDALKNELKECGIATDKLRRFKHKLERCLVISVKWLEEKYGIPPEAWNTRWPPEEDIGEQEELPDISSTPDF
ncbi:MAG: DUF3854 domain-containing protein [Thermacetogeniaceae bacterium]